MARTMLRFSPSHRCGSQRLRRRVGTVLGALLGLAAWAASASADQAVAFEELRGDQCFMFFKLVPRRISDRKAIELPFDLVINDEQNYKKLFDVNLVKESCGGLDLSKFIVEVDFSKKTVLAQWGSGTCADVDFTKRVRRDDARRTVTYSITTIKGTKLACLGTGLQSLNLIAIPKIPEGYQTMFVKDGAPN